MGVWVHGYRPDKGPDLDRLINLERFVDIAVVQYGGHGSVSPFWDIEGYLPMSDADQGSNTVKVAVGFPNQEAARAHLGRLGKVANGMGGNLYADAPSAPPPNPLRGA